jgi:hypothetical protein
MGNLGGTMANGRDASKHFRMENLHVPMPGKRELGRDWNLEPALGPYEN